MSTPREAVAAAIAAAHPTFVVRDWPEVPTNVRKGKPVVSVWRTEIAPASKRTHLSHEITVEGYVSGDGGKQTEAEADDLIDALMLVLEAFPGLLVGSAKRNQFNDRTLNGWTVDCTWISPNVYRAVTIKESEQA